MPLLLIFAFICIINSHIHAQGDNFSSGARSSALGNASVTLSDPYALQNNPAGLTDEKQISMAFNFQFRYGIHALNSSFLSIATPIKKSVAGVTFNRYGNTAYSEQSIGAGMAHQIGNISIGLKINWIQIRAEENFSHASLVGELGAIGKITNQIKCGVHVFNPLQNSIYTKNIKINLPVYLRVGIEYSPFPQLKIVTETFKNIKNKPAAKVAVEYSIEEKIVLRTGISFDIKQLSAGFGIIRKKFTLDYSFSNHPYLGNIHQTSLVIKIKRKLWP